MEPRIISRPAFMVVGLRYFGNNQNQEIPSLWTEFNRRCDALRGCCPGGFLRVVQHGPRREK